MKFNIIAAITSEWGLGYNGRLPWFKFTEDMKWFRELTADSIVIMGRKTWESMNSTPLAGRINIIVSQSLVNKSHEASGLSTQGAVQGVGLSAQGTQINEQVESNPIFFRKSLNDALSICKVYTKRKYNEDSESGRQIFVIGGVGLYQEALNHPDCHFVYLNRVTTIGKFYDYFPVDCYFPKLSGDHFQLSAILREGSADVGAWNRTIQSLPFCMIRYVRQVSQFGRAELNKTNLLTSSPQLLYFNENGYLRALSDILTYGLNRDDRTGVGTKSLFGLHFRYDLSRGFPLFTSKRTFWKGIVAELLWFLSGSTDTNILKAQGVHIWDGNSSREFLDKQGLKDLQVGDIGPSYGFQFRHQGTTYYGADWDYSGEGFDQVEYVVNQIRQNPSGRRALINLWNPADIGRMALPPCLYSYQFYVADGKISCLITQRSGDTLLGVPFNVASASLLTHMIGRLTGLQPKEIIHNIADAHIYSTHLQAVQEQITRLAGPWPQLEIIDKGQTKIADFKASDFKIIGYFPEGSIKAEMAI